MNSRFMLTQAEADFLHTLEKEFESGEVLPFATDIGNYVSWLNELNSEHIDALMAYNIRPLRWSKREEGVERLREERKLIA